MPGFAWLVVTSLVAGLVYGFAGFGSALIFMPVATIFLRPEVAVAAFSVSAVASLVTVVPRAWVAADRPGALTMLAGACVTAPLGIWVLRKTDPVALGWIVSLTVAVTLVALMRGWRYSAAPTPPIRLGVGAATGVIGGATGLMGPVMVLFQLAGRDPVARSRANAVVFLTLSSLALLPLMAFQGALSPTAVWLGLALLLPYGAGARIGQALFRPGAERSYRAAAYGLIAVAALAGLPVWR